MSEICVIGEKDYILCWQGLGIKTFMVRNIAETEEKLNQAVNEKYQFIFITETYADKLLPRIKQLTLETLSCITIIPGSKEKKDLGTQRLREISEKAVGVDLISKDSS